MSNSEIINSYALEDLPEIIAYNKIENNLIKVDTSINEEDDKYDEDLNNKNYADYYLISNNIYKKFLLKYLKNHFKEWNGQFNFINENEINIKIKDTGHNKKYVKNTLKLYCLPFTIKIEYVKI